MVLRRLIKNLVSVSLVLLAAAGHAVEATPESSSLPTTLLTTTSTAPPATPTTAVTTDLEVYTAASLPPNPFSLCPGYRRRPVCCKSAYIGFLYRGCIAPFPVPASTDEFVRQCDKVFKMAECCAVNLVSAALLLLILLSGASSSLWKVTDLRRGG